MTSEDAMRLIEDALETEHPPVKSPDQTLADIGWDSMASLSLIALVDERAQREMDARRIAQCQTVGELVALVLGNG